MCRPFDDSVREFGRKSGSDELRSQTGLFGGLSRNCWWSPKIKGSRNTDFYRVCVTEYTKDTLFQLFLLYPVDHKGKISTHLSVSSFRDESQYIICHNFVHKTGF